MSGTHTSPIAAPLEDAGRKTRVQASTSVGDTSSIWGSPSCHLVAAKGSTPESYRTRNEAFSFRLLECRYPQCRAEWGRHADGSKQTASLTIKQLLLFRGYKDSLRRPSSLFFVFLSYYHRLDPIKPCSFDTRGFSLSFNGSTTSLKR